MRMIPTIRRLLPRGIGLGIATTLAWLLLSGIYVQQQHQVPSITEFKASLANLTTCPGGDIRLVNDWGLSRAVLKFARQASRSEQATRPWRAVQDRG